MSMILPEDAKEKSLLLTQLIGFSIFENREGEYLLYLNNEYVGCFSDSYRGPCPVVDLYAPENLRLAWHAAAYGFLHFPAFKNWWEGYASDQPLSPFENQGHWLDKLLYLAFEEISLFMDGPTPIHEC